MHQLLEKQLEQLLEGREHDLPAPLLAAIDETYQKAEATQAELRREIQQARELEAVGRIAGGIAHDFNNLLTVIKGYCDLCLRLSAEDDGPVGKGLQQIADATERAAEMTVQLLTLSRRRKPDPVELDLNAVLRDFRPMLRRLVDGGTVLEVLPDEVEATVFADRGRAQQLFLNLVLQARETSAEPGTITLSSTLEPSWLVLSVQTSTPTSPRSSSAGLPVLDALAKEMSGELRQSADSSELVVRLPLADRAAAPLRQPKIDVAAARILVVEDEEPVRLMLEALLTDQGHAVTLSGTPHEALEHFKAHADRIDLLVTDIVMPGMHGPEMAEIMKEARPDLAVLFISGYDPAARERRGAPAPGGAFLQKPFDAATLNLKIREVLTAS